MKNFIRETFGYLGFASVTYGVALLNVPTAFILSGALLLWLSMPGKK